VLAPPQAPSSSSALVFAPLVLIGNVRSLAAKRIRGASKVLAGILLWEATLALISLLCGEICTLRKKGRGLLVVFWTASQTSVLGWFMAKWNCAKYIARRVCEQRWPGPLESPRLKALAGGALSVSC